MILASKSPRRRELMELIGHPFTCIPSSVKENIVNDETPARHVTILSELKARDVGAHLENRIIIGSDTIVFLNNDIFEKSGSPEEAVEMIMKLQGHTHTVYTGFALYDTASSKIFSSYEKTHVTMRNITRDLAQRYVKTGEPLDKAGAYGIQGYGAALITSINGCFFNVMGLPISRLMEALYAFSEGKFGYFGARRNQSNTFTAGLHT